MIQDDAFPFVEIYRGVGIHAGQSGRRIAVVKKHIDQVLKLSSAERLVAWTENVAGAPEARLLAAAKLQAAHRIAAETRTGRPSFDLEMVAATVAGLDGSYWSHPEYYCSMFDSDPELAAKREKPLR